MAKKEKKPEEPQYYTSATNNAMLNYRVYKLKPWEGLVFFIALVVIGGLVGLVFYGGLFRTSDGTSTFMTFLSNIVVFAAVGLIAFKTFIPSIVEMLKNRRLKALKMQFRDFLDSLSNSLAGGMNVNAALQNSYNDIVQQYSENALMALEIKEMLVGVENNIPIEVSLKNFGERSGIEDVENFATVFEVAYRTGGNINDIVRRTTDVISEKMIINEEIRTKLSSNASQMKIMNVIPIFLVLMMRFSSRDFDLAFSSPVGVVSITVGVFFFVASYKMGQKIMNIKG